MTTAPRAQQSPGDFDHFDAAWRTYLNVQDMVKYADQKVQVLLLLSTIICAFVLTNLKDLAGHSTVARIGVVLFLLATAAFFLLALVALVARRDTKTGTTVPRLIYFRHIAERTEAVEYCRAFRDANGAAFLDDVCYQISELGHIASAKFSYYRRAWWALGTQAVIFAALALGAAF